MGNNTKRMPNKVGVDPGRVQSQHNSNIKSPDESEKTPELSERDIAFICSQTGKLLLFLRHRR